MIRAPRPGEHDAIDRLHLDAFGDHGHVVGRLVHALRALAGSRPGLELIEERDGAVVGHAMWSCGWIDAPDRLVAVEVLSPLAVAPAHQRRGIGRALVAAGLERLTALAVPVVVLEGDPAYYARLGFVPGGDLGLARPSPRIPERAFQAMRLSTYEPWMTGGVVYPDAFWSLDVVGLR